MGDQEEIKMKWRNDWRRKVDAGGKEKMKKQRETKKNMKITLEDEKQMQMRYKNDGRQRGDKDEMEK